MYKIFDKIYNISVWWGSIISIMHTTFWLVITCSYSQTNFSVHYSRIIFHVSRSFYIKVPILVAPNEPKNLRVLNRNYNQIHVTWVRPDHFYGVIKRFSVVINDTYINNLVKQLKNETFYYTLQSLKPNTLYKIHIKAHTESTASDPSNELYVRTTMKPGNLVPCPVLFAIVLIFVLSTESVFICFTHASLVLLNLYFSQQWSVVCNSLRHFFIYPLNWIRFC